MRVAVVVLNWNTVGYLRDFVPGILESLGSEDALAVADSGSTDGSLEYLERNWPQVLREAAWMRWATLIAAAAFSKR